MLSHGNINAGVAGIQVQYEVCVRKIEVTFYDRFSVEERRRRGERWGGEVRERGWEGADAFLASFTWFSWFSCPVT